MDGGHRGVGCGGARSEPPRPPAGVSDMKSAALSIYVPAMADLHDQHGAHLVVNTVDHSIVTLADAILFEARELLATMRPRLPGESLDAGSDLAAVFAWESLQLFGGRRLDEQSITCHAASSL